MSYGLIQMTLRSWWGMSLAALPPKGKLKAREDYHHIGQTHKNYPKPLYSNIIFYKFNSDLIIKYNGLRYI